MLWQTNGVKNMSAYNDEPLNSNIYPPTQCNYGTMCNCEPAIVVIEVQKQSGKNMIVPFSKVCTKTPVGNVTNQLSPEYYFVRWLAWCTDCFMLHRDKTDEAKQTELEV